MTKNIEIDMSHLVPTPDRYKVAFVIPGVPIAKGRPRFRNQRTASGAEFVQTYTPKKTREFEAIARDAGVQAMGTLKPCVGPVQLSFVAFLPIPSGWTKAAKAAALQGIVIPVGKPDLDNFAKSLTDALNGVVYDDDSQIADVVMSKRYGERPRIVCEFYARDGFTTYRLQPKKTKGKK